MAHITVFIFSRLHLYSAGREPLRHGQKFFKSDGNLSLKRLVAWRSLALYRVGGVNGLLQILENFVHLERNISRKSWAWYLRAIVTFFVINFTWIFFRNGISDSCYIIRNLLCGISDFRTYFQTGIAGLGIDRYSLMTLLVFLIFLLAYDYFSLERDLLSAIAKYPVIPRWVCYTVFVVLICVFSRKGAGTEFVYFQF